MRKWAIIRLAPGQLTVLNKSHTAFTIEVDEAALFETKEQADVVASKLDTPTFVQELDVAESTAYDFPVPDYFDANDSFMTLAELLYFIRQDELVAHFTPVDKITGGNQMTGSAIHDPLDGKILGREFQFSFSRMLDDHDAVQLGEAIRQCSAWSYHCYHRKRLGFTGYAVLTLRTKNR